MELLASLAHLFAGFTMALRMLNLINFLSLYVNFE